MRPTRGAPKWRANGAARPPREHAALRPGAARRGACRRLTGPGGRAPPRGHARGRPPPAPGPAGAHYRAGPFFFFNDTAPTEIYTLSLHDALPTSGFSP